MNRILLYLILSSLALRPGLALASGETNAPSGPLDFNSFKIISDRNIFNASRSGRKPKNSRTPPRKPIIETIVLRGTLAYEKGQHAIFEVGTRQMDLKLGGEIKGYRITQITFDHVILLPAKGEPVKLGVGLQMRREDYGPWTLAGHAESTATEPASVSKSSSGSTAELPERSPESLAGGGDKEQEILRRLMEKRRQQMKPPENQK